MSIPLIQKPDKDDINTSIIAIKRQIERINMLLGLSNSEEIDTSKFATKDELQQAVTDLQPVDEVAVDNMHSVTSNAIANANIYDVEVEVDTGRTWAGHKVYRKMINKEFQSGISYKWVVSSEVGSGNYQVVNLGESMIHGVWGTRQPWYVGSMAEFFMDSGIVYFRCNHPDGIASLVCYYCKNS